MDQSLNQPWWIDVIKALVVINLVMAAFAYSTWLERKLLGRMQQRYGPNRAGPFGLLQPIADLVKLLRKESFFPANAIDVLYIAAPGVACFTALAAFSVIPFGGVWHVGDYDVTGWIANVSIGLLLILSAGSTMTWMASGLPSPHCSSGTASRIFRVSSKMMPCEGSACSWMSQPA